MAKSPTDLLTVIREVFLWIEAAKDWFPDFETRMINRERRLRIRYAEGKIDQERLEIELQAIADRRAAHAGR